MAERKVERAWPVIEESEVACINAVRTVRDIEGKSDTSLGVNLDIQNSYC